METKICPNKKERKIYTSKKETGADITLVEILPSDNLPKTVDYFEVDDSAPLDDKSLEYYRNKTICVIGYPNSDSSSNKEQKILADGESIALIKDDAFYKVRDRVFHVLGVIG